MSQPKLLVLSGSLRAGSYNHLLAAAAGRGAVDAGASIREIRLVDFDLPLYNEDEENSRGLPDGAKRLKDLFKAHHGLIIGCPEYNSAISAALKNAIDWVSRPREGEAPLECFNSKVVGLVAASPGALGGIRGLPTVRHVLSNIRSIVLPDQFALSMAHEAFDEQGHLKNDKQRQMAEAVGRRVAEVAAAVGKVTA